MLTTIGAALLRFRYYRLIGRFHGLRRLAATLRRLGARYAARPLPDHRQRDDRIAAWLEEVRRRSYCAAPRLGRGTVAAIRRYAERQPCRQANAAERFRIGEVRDGRSPRGSAIAIADVVDPAACPEVARVAADPVLLEVASRFLGYPPRRTRMRLYWSPVSPVSDSLRRAAGQTIDFHYDIDACNSFYVYFYLVGGGPTSGAHVVVEGSHGPKPMRIAVGSSFQREAAILDLYGADKITVVSGGPGFGFFEDPACFHKALAPTRTARLCLQLRYS